MNPLGIALKSIRANLVPMAVLWLLAALTVWGYYRFPQIAAILEPLAKWQRDTGWPAAVVNRTVFCGLLPGVFLLTVRSIRPRHPWRTVLANCLWMGQWGLLSNAFFTLQAQVFGIRCSFTGRGGTSPCHVAAPNGLPRGLGKSTCRFSLPISASGFPCSSRSTCSRFPCRSSLSALQSASGRSSGFPLASGSRSRVLLVNKY